MKPTEQLGVVGVVATLGILALVSFLIGMDTLKEWVLAAGPWAPLAFIALKASTIIIAPLSGSPLYPIVGAFFGFWPGILYVVIGDFIGYTAAFWLSRVFGYPLVERMLSKGEHPLLRKVVNHASTTRGFFHMILTLGAMPELICYGTGLSRFPYLKFIAILWPLSWTVSMTLVFAGSVLGADQGILFSFLIPAVAAGVIALGVWLFMRGVNAQK